MNGIRKVKTIFTPEEYAFLENLYDAVIYAPRGGGLGIVDGSAVMQKRNAWMLLKTWTLHHSSSLTRCWKRRSSGEPWRKSIPYCRSSTITWLRNFLLGLQKTLPGSTMQNAVRMQGSGRRITGHTIKLWMPWPLRTWSIIQPGLWRRSAMCRIQPGLMRTQMYLLTWRGCSPGSLGQTGINRDGLPEYFNPHTV